MWEKDNTTLGSPVKSIGVAIVAVTKIGVPSPSPPPVASESINKNPLAAVAEEKGESTPTGITLGLVSNTH